MNGGHDGDMGLQTRRLAVDRTAISRSGFERYCVGAPDFNPECAVAQVELSIGVESREPSRQ